MSYRVQLTDEQFARLPDPVLQDIVLADRRFDVVRSEKIVPIKAARFVREMRAERDAMTAGAHRLYGRAPLKGENGPGRSTAVAG